jgi:hypothetical protein
MERLLQALGGVLRLAAVACEALLRLQTTTLSDFGMFLSPCAAGDIGSSFTLWCCP